MSQTVHETNDHGRHTSMVKGKHAMFVNNIIFCWIVWLTQWENTFECAIHFSTSFGWYAFPNLCTQISRPLVYSVCISLKASVTADNHSHNVHFTRALVRSALGWSREGCSRLGGKWQRGIIHIWCRHCGQVPPQTWPGPNMPGTSGRNQWPFHIISCWFRWKRLSLQ